MLRLKKKSLESLFHSAAFYARSPNLSLYLMFLLRLTHLVSDCLSDMRLWYPWEWFKAVLLSCSGKCKPEGPAVGTGTN